MGTQRCLSNVPTEWSLGSHGERQLRTGWGFFFFFQEQSASVGFRPGVCQLTVSQRLLPSALLKGKQSARRWGKERYSLTEVTAVAKRSAVQRVESAPETPAMSAHEPRR